MENKFATGKKIIIGRKPSLTTFDFLDFCKVLKENFNTESIEKWTIKEEWQ